ncbi:MAG: right-handed parallel beta-helix repeat-containing protein, partial [Thermoplasmatales archaeon]|nr:right-handed parallel beta-helix repeat-containing protein [Thermoplasmatales archaeon]
MRKMRKLVIMVCIAAMIMTNIPNWDAGADVSGTAWSEAGDTLIGNATVWKDEIITLNGNLTVNETGNLIISNVLLTLNGNLTINETGSLTLDNVTLLMNCTENGSYHIEVQPGGEMYILNNSNITSANEYRYLFLVKNDSTFEMRDSELSECGYEWGVHGDHNGLWINTDNTTIYNSSFSNCMGGILFYQVKNFSVSNCNFSNNNVGVYLSQATNITIKECSFSNNTYGTVVDSSSQITIVGCDYVSNGNTIYSKSDNRNPRVIVLNPSAINCYDSSGIEVIDCILSENNYGICLSSSSNSTISNCTISSNSNKGIHLNSSSNNQIINCTAYNNYNAIYLYASSNNQITSAIIYNNSHDGIQLCYSSNTKITNCAAYNNTHTGISLFYSSNNKITNCSIYNNTYGTVLYDSTNNKIVNSTIINSTGYNLFLAQNSQLISLNTTFTNVSFADNVSTLNVSWYLNVNVTWKNNISAEYANVRIQDNENGTFDKNYTTDKTGWIKDIVIQEYTQNQTAGKTFFTPHNVTASQGGISVWDDNVTVDETKTVELILDHDAPVINYTTISPEQEYTTDENTTVEFSFNVSHPDNLTLTYYWYLNGNETFNDTLENTNITQKINWTYYFNYTSHENSPYTINVTVSDGNATVSYEWKLTVNDVNGRPEITYSCPPKNMILDSYAYARFNITASDPDNDNITYHWKVTCGGLIEEIYNQTEYIFNASENATNTYIIEVTVTDNVAPPVNHTWTVVVLDL